MAKKNLSNLFLPFVLLLLLLFTTSHSQTHPKDLAALRQIKNSLTDIPGGAAKFFSTWNFSADPCSSFAGVTCVNSRVTILSLGTGLSDSPGLAGTLSGAAGDLTELTQLILFAGIVTGPVPYQIGWLRNLKVLSLTNNRLTGSIPVQIWRLSNLHTLDLSHNRLTGWVSPSITRLNRLKVLVLAGNSLSWQLPRRFPVELLHLDLSGNFFSATLPPQMPPGLRYLALSNNRMWGPIDAVGSLSELEYLDLSMNRFSGPIPTSLFRPSITSILLQRNNFSGLVPHCPPWQSTVGTTIDLSHNFLTGELSGSLIGVESLFLNNNRLRGPVPEGYVAAVKAGSMKTLYLQHNYLTSFPLEVGSIIPDAVAVCMSYNCMVEPPVGMNACPASAGDQISRPAYQCPTWHN